MTLAFNIKLSLGIGFGTLMILPAFAAVKAPARYTQGIVASDHVLASQAGRDMLKRGGNAYDAAIATSMVLSVVRPQSTGIGGGGFMVHHHKKTTRILDYREIAPAKASRDMYLDAKKEPIPGASTTGFQAAAVPGLMAGLAKIHRQYAKLSLNVLMAPAIHLAEHGFAADDHFVHASEVIAKRGASNDVKNTFFIHGKPAHHGDLIRNPALAKTLRLLAKDGLESFYTGEVSRQIAQAMPAQGLISAKDLNSYRPRERKPLIGYYRGYKIATMPPPSSGGVAILTMLNLLEPYPLHWNALGFGSSQYTHLVSETMKHAFSDRAHFLGDPDFVNVPIEELTSKAYAKTLQPHISMAQNTTLSSEYYGKKGLSHEAKGHALTDHGTTHYAIMDKAGNVVSATETINTYFGSQAVIPGTGILLNNEMDDFSKRPGVPNAFGLVGTEANAIAPGKKPLSSMSPTLVFDKNNKPFLALGASGGPRIITGTFLSLLNVLDYGMNVREAVSAPRFHHQWKPNILNIEKEMPQDVQSILEQKGHTLKTGDAENVVQAVMLKNGYFTGASDPRKGGEPAGY